MGAQPYPFLRASPMPGNTSASSSQGRLPHCVYVMDGETEAERDELAPSRPLRQGRAGLEF